MAFNHYAKIKRILADYADHWYIRRMDEPTSAKNFRGETVKYDYYYQFINIYLSGGKIMMIILELCSLVTFSYIAYKVIAKGGRK